MTKFSADVDDRNPVSSVFCYEIVLSWKGVLFYVPDFVCWKQTVVKYLHRLGLLYVCPLLFCSLSYVLKLKKDARVYKIIFTSSFSFSLLLFFWSYRNKTNTTMIMFCFEVITRIFKPFQRPQLEQNCYPK